MTWGTQGAVYVMQSQAGKEHGAPSRTSTPGTGTFALLYLLPTFREGLQLAHFPDEEVEI